MDLFLGKKHLNNKLRNLWVLIFFRLVIVEQGGQSIQSSGNLEDLAHLVLQELIEAAIVVEAELR